MPSLSHDLTALSTQFFEARKGGVFIDPRRAEQLAWQLAMAGELAARLEASQQRAGDAAGAAHAAIVALRSSLRVVK